MITHRLKPLGFPITRTRIPKSPDYKADAKRIEAFLKGERNAALRR